MSEKHLLKVGTGDGLARVPARLTASQLPVRAHTREQRASGTQLYLQIVRINK